MTASRRSLRVELIATLTVILMMAAVSLSLAGEVLGQRRHRAREDQRLLDHANALGSLLAPLLGKHGPAALERGAVEQALRPAIGVLGIETIELLRFVEGRPQSVMLVGLPHDLAPPEPSLLETPDGVVSRRNDIVVVDRAVRTFGTPDTPVAMRIVARTTPWIRDGDWQAPVLLAAGIGSVLLILGIALLDRQVLRPLADVRAAVGEVGLGNLRTRVPTAGPAEIAALGEAFNAMTSSLRERVEELRAQREHLVRAEQLASVGRISAGVAHEVGNPLAAILGYVELLLDPRSEPPLSVEQRDLLDRTRIQLERIQGIVGQLLDYSRPSMGRARPVDLAASLRGLLALLRHDPRCKDVELRVAGPEPLMAVVDEALVEQVVVNLVVNGARAARSADEPRVVEVRLASEEGGVAIEVQDTGPGVPDADRPHLFEPFFTTSKPGEGTGLGLAICQGLCERMGGRLTCLPGDARPPLNGSQTEGSTLGKFAGAVFRVTLRCDRPERS